jgi:hypothetical protein
MTLPRLCSRLEKLEVLRRPWVVADVLQRARQCAPSELGAFSWQSCSGETGKWLLRLWSSSPIRKERH